MRAQFCVGVRNSHAGVGVDNPSAVHKPYTSPPGWPVPDPASKSYDQDVYYQTLQRMDEGVGNVTRALRKHGLWENAIVLFFGDNGGTDKNNNFPLRGGKHNAYEGGVRGTAFVSGPALTTLQRACCDVCCVMCCDVLECVLCVGCLFGQSLWFLSYDVVLHRSPFCSSRQRTIHHPTMA